MKPEGKNTHFDASQFINMSTTEKVLFDMEVLRDELDEDVARMRITIERFIVLRRQVARDIGMSEDRKLAMIVDIDQDIREARAIIEQHQKTRRELDNEIRECRETA